MICKIYQLSRSRTYHNFDSHSAEAQIHPHHVPLFLIYLILFLFSLFRSTLVSHGAPYIYCVIIYCSDQDNCVSTNFVDFVELWDYLVPQMHCEVVDNMDSLVITT